MKKCSLFRVFFYLEMLLLGQLFILIVLGADYGLNCKWLNTTNKGGFSPFYISHYPQRFYIMDQEGEIIGKDFTLFSPRITIKEILSYSFYDDTLFVKCQSSDNETIILSPIYNHGQGLSRAWKLVSSYPIDTVEVQIAGNSALFSLIIHLKRIISLLLIAIVFIHILVILVSRKTQTSTTKTSSSFHCFTTK